MVFSSLLFLGIFLPVTLFFYFICKNIVYRNVVLVIASLIFYAWGEPVWVLLLLLSTMVNYTAGLVIKAYRGRPAAKAALIAALVISLGLLATFKYAGWIVENINAFLPVDIPFYGFALPLGISFFTFQTLSYTIDVYRGDVKVQKNPIYFLCYVSMFPQLVAGPIVRYSDIAREMNSRSVTAKDFEYGILRFTQGMLKKVVIANGIGAVATALLDGDLTKSAALSAWLGMLAYTFQIYFDFSSYSDMAIGMGRMFGFHFLENFNYPYISKSVTDFWRRWHMSLSSFFRDYVYIPLGGNRRHQMLNIFVVWMLTGLWHGASWNFVLWGVYYGLLLMLEKKAFGGRLMRLPAPLGILYNSIVVLFGWALFYYTDFTKLKQWFVCAFGGTGVLCDFTALSTLFSNLWLFLICLIGSTPVIKLLFKKVYETKVLGACVTPVLVLLVLAGCFILLVGQSFNPFLYFRF